jgi:hypothetical protein
MSLKGKYPVPCSIMEIDDSCFRENDGEERRKRWKERCGNCKFWMWKIGTLGICKLTNQTVSEDELCGFYKTK